MQTPSTRPLTVLISALIFSVMTPTIFAQASWVEKVIKQRERERKESIAAFNSAKLGVTDEDLLKLVDREKHGPAVAFAVGQYFEKAKQVPESFQVFRELMKRRDLADKAVVYAAMSPISEALIAAMADSDEEIDRMIAARMIASIAYMRYTDRQAKQVPQEEPAKPGAPAVDDTPAWLKGDHTEQLAKLIESSKSRTTLECALLAIGLDENAALLEQAQAHTTHRVTEVAYAARYAVAAMGGELDRAVLLADLQGAESKRGKDPLSFDIRQTPLVYLMMAAGEAELTEATETIFTHLKDRDIHTAVAAARALGNIGGDGLSVRLIQAISEDTPWPVRVAIYDAAGANPDAAAVPVLLERFKAESGRLRQDALYALLSIAADADLALTVEDFNQWWQANGEAFEANANATRAWREANKVGDVYVTSFAGFYETGVISDSLVFAVDASKSIDEKELELLHQSLKDLFESLPADLQFNLIDFGGHVRVLGKGRMVSGKVRDRALDVFLKQTKLTVGTRIFEAIEASMDLPDVDSVHFLSDGQPWASQLNHWQRVDYATRLRTATVPIAVHLVYLPNKGDPKQIANRPLSRHMRALSDAHAGRFQILAPVKK